MREKIRARLEVLKEKRKAIDKRLLIPMLAVLCLIVIGIWYALSANQVANGGPLQASGTIEAVDVLIAPELAGRVAQVMVTKGDLVQAGDPLLRLDDALLSTQRQRTVAAVAASVANLSTAQAALEAANAQLDSAKANAEALEATSQAELITAQQALDELNDSADLIKAQALNVVAVANRAVYDAQYMLDNLSIPSNQINLETQEAIDKTKARLDKAVADFEPYKYEPSTDPTREDLLDALEEARSDYNAAVRRLEYEAAVDQAEATLAKAMLDLDKVKDGPDPDDVAILEARIEAAQAAPTQAEAMIKQAEAAVLQAQAALEQAQAVVAQAQAELDMIDEQISRLVLYAPKPGVVLSSDIEAGEVVQAGAVVMSIGQLDQLTITVYVPEDRFGQVKLGMKARVNVDSFPGERFNASVIYIADEAEFTPRNVQTVEGRKTTVFAVELSIANPQGKLKPGMPADVSFYD